VKGFLGVSGKEKVTRGNAGNALSGRPAVAAGQLHTPIREPEALLISSRMILNAG